MHREGTVWDSPQSGAALILRYLLGDQSPTLPGLWD